MKSTELYEAFRYVDDRYLDTVGFADKEESIMTKSIKNKRVSRWLLIAAAVALFVIMGTAAYAQNLWGIRGLWPGTSAEHTALPEEAASQVQMQNEAYEGEDWSCRLTETLCDAYTAMATVTVYGGDRYVVVPTDSAPTDPAASLGFDGNGTLAEYAEARGKELLAVGAYLSCEEDVFGSGFIHFESISDNEMVILASSDKKSPTELTTAVCVVRANGREVELPFPITEGYTKEVGVFAPENPDAVPGISVGEAVVTETALGIYVRFPVSVADASALENIVVADCEGLEGFRSGGFVCGADGGWYAELNYVQGTVGDVITVGLRDLGENPVGEIVFTRK